MWSSNTLRETFLSFFAQNDHKVIPSSPLVPRHDPSLMFTAAGMVPFKDVFTGLQKPSYPRAVSSQKCLRAGGKHNDLENVGYTARHHTFFEMLGNFSFGDYFKAEAIQFSWEMVTKVLQLEQSKLLVTVYYTDEEAFGLWKKISGLPESRIIRIATDDNFWAMGETGPCGSCSEIFYDHGSNLSGGIPGSANEDGDRFVEIWNLVFMQYERVKNGSLIELPNPSIDTGAGLERLLAVLQNVHNNYDTDLFQNIIKYSIDVTGKKEEQYINSHRIIADHLRASGFLVADGMLPSNEGRGYVLRRIMRRAMRHAYLLGQKEPLLCKLVPCLIAEMGLHYPELQSAESLIYDALYQEEEKFKATLGKGLKIIAEESEKLALDQKLSGEVAFKLYDTYGFPLDLTQDVMRGYGKQVDTAGFDIAMAQQKKMARSSWSGSGEKKDDKCWYDLAQQLQPTDFVGYVEDSICTKVVGLVENDTIVQSLTGKEAWVVTEHTPFYAESGGQIGDIGTIKSKSFVGRVTDCIKKPNEIFAHKVTVEQGKIRCGDEIELIIDTYNRDLIKSNHSATHLLHSVLRNVLGANVVQKGSLVNGKKLRFDFSYNRAISRQQIDSIENEVNQIIFQNSAVSVQEMPLQQALSKGAISLFGEKYADNVRVVSIGQNDQGFFSVELCGGTHVNRTGDIGYFKIISEASVGSGIRRIEAVTGCEAVHYSRNFQVTMEELSALLKTNYHTLNSKLSSVLDENKKLLKENAVLRDNSCVDDQPDSSSVQTVGKVAVLAKHLTDSYQPKDMRSLADKLRTQIPSGVIILCLNKNGKGSIVVSVSDDLTNIISAIDLVNIASPLIGGARGGGRTNMAQTGGPDGRYLDSACAKILEFLAKV